jgi:UDP-2,4-diacetamido-2,4,6-trideoxy-beta-L-altropyranose hydrolase
MDGVVKFLRSPHGSNSLSAKPPLLLIRADASAGIGAGHVMRCLALAKAWQKTGAVVVCVMAESIAALEERLLREDVAVKKIAAEPGSKADADRTIAEAHHANPAWVVVDGYCFDPIYISNLKAAGLRTMFLDDDGRFDSYPAHAVLNQNISASSPMYAKRDASTQLLLGPEYVLLRPEFLIEPRAREHPAIARKVLVTMGGSDSENVTGKILVALLAMDSNFEAKIVVGAGSPWQNELQALAIQRRGFELVRSPANMASLMRWADAAISGAGGTVWELAYLGLPAIVIALSQDQRQIARGLADNDVAVSLGWHANLSDDCIIAALRGLLADRKRRLAMSELSQKLVDGRGAERVVTFLQKVI